MELSLSFPAFAFLSHYKGKERCKPKSCTWASKHHTIRCACSSVIKYDGMEEEAILIKISRCNSAKWTLLHKSRQAQGPLVQKDVSNLCSLSALVTPPHHLIGTRPSREWEIVSLKIACPLFWLAPPSNPPSKAQGCQSREKHPEKQQP